MHEWSLYLVVGILGALIGSFLNVCIFRLPRGESIAWPGSHCPSCAHPIAFYDNIPLLSFLWLGGRCRACRAPISIRYPPSKPSMRWAISPSLFVRPRLDGRFLCPIVFGVGRGDGNGSHS